MSTVVVLDSGPLGMVSNPRPTPANEQCTRWLEGLLDRGIRGVVPEIADYEIRRELIRAQRTLGLRRLDELKETLEYRPITTSMMIVAAEFWAVARDRGTPTAEPAALDADVILAAQASSLADVTSQPVIATTNVGHLAQFVAAELWFDIE